jgi:hypothetical protein
MYRLATFVIAAAAFGLHLAQAQDIASMEDCTKTNGLDKRTGCFQSNIEYLNRVIAKNAADVQQKLTAANAEIGALKKTIATLQTSVEQLQNAAKKPDAKDAK